MKLICDVWPFWPEGEKFATSSVVEGWMLAAILETWQPLSRKYASKLVVPSLLMLAVILF
jgi:hypothetical protein